MHKAPSIVVFDVGNVLVRWQPEVFYRGILQNEGALRFYLDNVHTPEWNLELDRGMLEWGEFFDRRIAAFPQWEKPLRAYQENWFETLREVIAPNVALLRELKTRGIPVYAITNFTDHTFRKSQKHHDFLTLFDGAIVSGAEKLVKPEPEIYRLFGQRYGLSLGDCVFIDDSAVNIAAARAEGMHAIHFVEPMDVADSLRKLGVAGL